MGTIKTGLEQYHSPEQIAGRLQGEDQKRCSHETIYQMIATNRYGFGKYRTPYEVSYEHRLDTVSLQI